MISNTISCGTQDNKICHHRKQKKVGIIIISRNLFAVPQTGPPVIALNRRKYTVGEKLEANCTTSKAHPAPHITWLINGKKVIQNLVHKFRSQYLCV